MSIRVYIVDDDPIAIQGMVMLIRRIPELYLVGTETDPVAALSKILSGVIKADIIFLDIDMPDLGGLEMSRQIAGNAVIIFVTGHAKYALEAYATDAADFLTKPPEFAELLRAIKKAKEKLVAREKLAVQASFEQSIFVKLSPRNMVKIRLKELIYIEVDDKYLKLHLQEGKPLSIKKSLTYTEEILPKNLFLRISKSCIVNLDRILSIVGNRIVMDAAPVLEIGSSYMEEVYSRYDAL
jgi:DNA-binding LytR/AlgR family response regulator